MPWAYDDEAVDVVRFFTKLKLSLMPYLYSGAVKTSETGIPMMRSMALEFEGDKNCEYLDKQYMLGDNILVAPIFNEEGESSYYLPAGTWTNYLTGETAEGGCWRTERHGYLSIPMWVRANSIVATGIQAERADYDFKDNVEMKVYQLAGTAESVVYQEHEKVLKLQLTRGQSAEGTKEEVTGKVTGVSGCKVRFVNCKAVNVRGAASVLDGNDTVITLERDGEFHCEITE